MRISVIAVLCLIAVVRGSASPRNSRKPVIAHRQQQRNEVPREDYLPYWDPQPSNPRHMVLTNITVVPRQYPGQGSPALDSSDSFTGSNNEIPRPIPPRPEISHPRPPRPPRPPGCLKERGQFASARSCAHYLNCWDGNVIEQQCPHELLFNEQMSYCDYEYNVDCGGRPEYTKPSLAQGNKRCPDPNGRYRSALNCSEFYICLGGSPIKFNCPEGLVYNDQIHVCDFLEKVDCRGSATPKPLPVEEEAQPEFYPDYPEQPAGFPLQPEISVEPVVSIQPGYPSQAGGSYGQPLLPAQPSQIGYPGLVGQFGSVGTTSTIINNNQQGASSQPGLSGQGGVPSRPGHIHRPHHTSTTHRPIRPSRPSRPHHRPIHRPSTSTTTPQPSLSIQPQPDEFTDPNPNPPYPAGGNDFPTVSGYRWSTRVKADQWQQRHTQIKDEPEQDTQVTKNDSEKETESIEESELEEESTATTIVNP